jgi:hypothetical protein
VATYVIVEEYNCGSMRYLHLDCIKFLIDVSSKVEICLTRTNLKIFVKYAYSFIFRVKRDGQTEIKSTIINDLLKVKIRFVDNYLCLL